MRPWCFSYTNGQNQLQDVSDGDVVGEQPAQRLMVGKWREIMEGLEGGGWRREDSQGEQDARALIEHLD